MSFRIVKFSRRCKLETKLGYLVYRTENEIKILLEEISAIIVESPQVCLTSALISELMSRNIRVIFCDSKHLPQGELEPYYSCYDTRTKIKQQLSWDKKMCDIVWKQIIRQKIFNQQKVLKLRNKNPEVINLLEKYINEVNDGDNLNREGLAAKIYFPSLFNPYFDRHSSNDIENIFLDYGYSLIQSYISKEISTYGYHNPFGIHHCSERNFYNLSCDLMEPFRPLVDYIVSSEYINEDNFKRELISLLSTEVECNGKIMIFENAIKTYVLSVFSALNNNKVENMTYVTLKDE